MGLFKKATKSQLKLRLALIGPAGSGKTYSALSIAQGLGNKIALIDTEHRSASKYAGTFSFDTLQLENFDPDNYVAGMIAAQKEGYDVVIIDSLSHAWTGKGGILEFVDEEKRKSRSGNAFSDGWGKATPKQNRLVETMLALECHLIVTMRSKVEYVIEKDPNGKTQVRKVGMQPVQRDGLEYEFDVVGDLNQDNDYIITKSRCSEISGHIYSKPGKEFSTILLNWLTDGVPVEKEIPVPVSQPVEDPQEMTIEKAKTVKTPKGVLVWDMTMDQLQKMLDYLTDNPPQNEQGKDVLAAAIMRFAVLQEGEMTEPE